MKVDWRQGRIVAALALTGCAMTARVPPMRGGDAASHAPPGTVRYSLGLGDISSGSNLIEQVAPAYPPSLLPACPPPVEITALLIVNRAGKVGEVRVADEAEADADRHLFMAAVRAAAQQWLFNPLLVSHWAADLNGNSHVVDSAVQPFSLTRVFRFECHAGKARVSSDAGG